MPCLQTVPGLGSVSVRGDSSCAVTRQKTRLFGLKEAPTLHPTAEEFKDPHAYLRQVLPLGQKFGVLKIVPPHDWSPPFSLNLDRFKFKTRRQTLNSMGAISRTALEFCSRLQRFHSLLGNNIPKTPCIGPRRVNYHVIKTVVEALGGLQAVEHRYQGWNQVAAMLGVPEYASTVQSCYHAVIDPYLRYCAHVMTVLDVLYKYEDGPQQARESQTEPVKQEPVNDVSVKMRLRKRKVPDDELKSDDQEQDSNCYKCGVDVVENQAYLQCKECEALFHRGCIDTQLSLMDSSGHPDWFCPKCLVSLSKFYYGEGSEYKLPAFKEKADQYRDQYLERMWQLTADMTARFDANAMTIVEEYVESQFWNHVGDLANSVTVDYGADVPCNKMGSGFPVHNSAYARDPWNLNNIASSRNSLFHYMGTAISGITVPWAYVGMMFSAFCWHSEDHYTYSLNYQHLGATKTWYGIPGYAAQHFERVSASIVPELFQKFPDAFDQRSTIISPDVLVKNQVPVYVVDQRPGEFVVTFPKAYHCGFNHGFNINEAVNYAPPEWLDFGRECLESYRLLKKLPIFSHDALLLAAAKRCRDKDTAEWLIEPLTAMIAAERSRRSDKAARFPTVATEPVRLMLRARESKMRCEACNYLSFLSQYAVVSSDGTRTLFCHKHVPASAQKLVFQVSRSDQDLDQIIEAVERLVRGEESKPLMTHVPLYGQNVAV